MLLLLISPVAAQQTTERPAADSPSDDDDIIVLSPFQVDADEDEGYRATSTLAGSRIKTDLKDVAASITVVTKQFLDDIGAADMNDVLAYTANTEGTRDYTATVNSLGRPTDDVASNPFGSNRVRGLQSADTTRDYFYTINNWIGFDTYNLDQVTVNRGPNSVLAGLGSPAGIVNYSPQAANANRNSNLVSLRVGSHSDVRALFNSNIVAKEGVLGFRLAGVWSDRGFAQQPAYFKDRRINFSATYHPWEKTTIRAGYEIAHVKANNPNSITPEDGISQWLELGSPTYDSARDGATIPAPLGSGGTRPTVVYGADGDIEGFWTPQQIAVYGQQNLDGVSLWQRKRMNSNRYLDLFGTNLNPSLDDRSFEAFNVSIDQELAKGLFANVAYVQEEVHVSSLNLFRSEYAVYNIDPNVRLPDGSPNPHFGETYMEYRGLDNKGWQYNTNEVLRGTVTYDLDLREISPWLGRYNFTGFLESRETDFHSRQWNARPDNEYSAYEDYANRYYLGGSATSRPTTTPGHPDLVQGVPAFPPTMTAGGATSLNGVYRLKSDRKRIDKLDTKAVAVQAYLWDNKIVGMFGYREDTNEAAESVGQAISGTTAMVNLAGPYPALTEFTDETTTYGVVVHPLKWLSLHYNQSENFVPNAGKVDLLGNPTPAPTGEGKDYGFSLNLLDDKLNVKLNWFEITAAGASAESVTFPLNQWTIPFLELTIMPDIASTPAFQADHPGFVYEKAMADGLITGDTPLNGGYTSDQVSEGLELEFTYNVTKNWRLMGSVAKQEARQSNIAGSLTEFINERLQYWESTGLFDYPVSPGGGWGQTLTGREYWERDSLGAFISYQSGEGRPSTQLAKWHASALTNYSFTEGPLNGFHIGGGARYIEAAVIGHPVILDDQGRVTALDLDNPYKNDAKIALDLWMGYQTKIMNDKYDLRLQLNIRDVFEDGEFAPIGADSDGNLANFRIVQPRTFYLTTTLEF